MEVILRSTNRRFKRKVIKDHYWYDPDTKQRLHGRGGRLIFVYDYINKKSVPRIIDLEEWVYDDSYDEIIRWTRNTGVLVENEVPRHYVLINVHPNEWSDLEEDLYYHEIQYEIIKDNSYTENREKKKWQNSLSKWPIRHQH